MSVMSWLSNLGSTPEAGTRAEDRQIGRLELFGIGEDGLPHTPDQALRLSVVWACTTLIADSVAGLSANVYVGDGGARRQVKSPMWMDQPNPEMTWFEFMFAGMMSVLTDGNSFYEIVPNPVTGEPLEVWPLNPHTVTVWRFPGARDRRYSVMLEDLTSRMDLTHTSRSNPGGILQVRGYTMPTMLRGLSPLGYAKATTDLAGEAGRYGLAQFRNSAIPGGVIEVDGPASQPLIDSLTYGWNKAHQGSAKAGTVGVLTDGAKWKPASVTSRDSQWIELRGFQTAELARFYRMPLHMIGDITNSTSWGSGLQEMGLGFLTFTLRRWLTLYEQSFSRYLLPRGQYVEFDPNDLLRVDMKARFEAMAIARHINLYSLDELRDIEDLPPAPPEVPQYLVPLNLEDPANPRHLADLPGPATFPLPSTSPPPGGTP